MNIIRSSYILFFVCLLLNSCDLSQSKTRNKLKLMSSNPISFPFAQMQCWSNDSLFTPNSYNQAELKLVHYIDSDRCSSCYLQKIACNSNLNRLEKESKGKFVNIFIAAPTEKGMKKLLSLREEKILPSVVFVDTARVFINMNSFIPSESIYHTFLLDYNNKVVSVGNPLYSKELDEMFVRVFNKKINNYKIKTKRFFDK